MPKIRFPKIEKKAQLCFVRKYRNKGKSYYVFYRANLKKKVSEVIKSWLEKNISKVNNKEFQEYTIDNFQEKEFINLDSVDSWIDFKEKAFTLSEQEEADLENIKNNLIAFIIYIKQESKIFGYIRKLAPSNVLDKTGLFSIFLDNSTFNDIKEQKGIQVDEYFDLAFIINEEGSQGVINNKYNFNAILDLIEQQRGDSIRVLESNNFFKVHPKKTDIENIVKGDRMIQKMLLNPLVKEHMNEIDFKILKELKGRKCEEVCFELDEKSNQIIFPEGKLKEAIHSFIKAISWRYSKSLDDKYILEESPIKIVK